MIDGKDSPEEVFDELMEDNDKLWDTYHNLRAYNVPEEEVLQSIKGKYTSAPEYPTKCADSPQSDEINRFDITPSTDAVQLGEKMQGDSEYVVYFTECEILGGSLLRDVKSKAVHMLPSVSEAPDWVYHAWKSDRVYYIGQTSNFGNRLDAHCNNVRCGSNSAHEPSMLTAISDVIGAGIIRRVDDRCTAEKLEEYAAKKWSTEDHRRFVYYA
jgi:predicted GIY-YIG superfamily endonuclease